jgi:two-component system, NarL family, response regulator DevR
MTDPDADALPPLRVLVVDADDRVRESLAGLLCIGDRCVVVGTAGDAVDALSQVDATHPDVVIVDPRLPGMDIGLAFIDRLRTDSPDVRVVAMGWADGPEADAVNAGVDGWIRKTFRPSELVAAVVAAVAETPDTSTPPASRSGMVL